MEIDRANECAGRVFELDGCEDGEYALVYSLRDQIFGLYFIPDGIVNDWNWAKSPTDIVENADWLMG